MIAPQFCFVDQPACQLCGNEAKEPLDSLEALGYEFTWVVCRQCRLIYMDPVPDPASYITFYEQAFWQIKSGELPTKGHTKAKQGSGPGIQGNVRRQRLLRIPRVETVLAPLLNDSKLEDPKEPWRVLEIGCSWGQTLAHLHREHGAEVFGVEPSERARAFLADRHFEIDLVANSCEELDQRRDLDGTMDVVLFSHCLENITDQNRALTTARRLLRKDGTLYIDTPNFFWNQPQNPYHPFIYTPETLSVMLTKHGFTTEASHTTPAPGHSHLGNVITFARHRDQHCAIRARPATPVPPAERPLAGMGDASKLLAKHRAGRRAVASVERLGNLPRGVLSRAPMLRALLKSVRR